MWRWQKRAWFPILKLEARRWQTSSVGLLYGQAVNGISWVQPAVAARSITAWESPKFGYYLQIISPLEKLICSSPSWFRFAVCHDPFIFLGSWICCHSCMFKNCIFPPFLKQINGCHLEKNGHYWSSAEAHLHVGLHWIHRPGVLSLAWLPLPREGARDGPGGAGWWIAGAPIEQPIHHHQTYMSTYERPCKSSYQKKTWINRYRL